MQRLLPGQEGQSRAYKCFDARLSKINRAPLYATSVPRFSVSLFAPSFRPTDKVNLLILLLKRNMTSNYQIITSSIEICPKVSLELLLIQDCCRFLAGSPYTATWSGIKSAQDEKPPCPQVFKGQFGNFSKFNHLLVPKNEAYAYQHKTIYRANLSKILIYAGQTENAI